MSKKYVIEIKPEYEDKFRGIMILGAENSNLYVDSVAVDELEELNSDYINENFGELQDQAYQKGFEDGKAQENRGCGGCRYEPMSIEQNPCRVCQKAYLNHYNPKPMDDEIRIGDEVRLCRHKVPYIVTSCDGDDDTYILMTVNGGFIKAEKYNVRKTGRHFDIEKILEAMKE